MQAVLPGGYLRNPSIWGLTLLCLQCWPFHRHLGRMKLFVTSYLGVFWATRLHQYRICSWSPATQPLSVFEGLGFKIIALPQQCPHFQFQIVILIFNNFNNPCPMPLCHVSFFSLNLHQCNSPSLGFSWSSPGSCGQTPGGSGADWTHGVARELSDVTRLRMTWCAKSRGMPRLYS